MKLIPLKFHLAFIVSLISVVAPSQENKVDGLLFGKNILGTNLSSVKDSLFCAEGNNALYSSNPEMKCHSFIYTFSNNEKIYIDKTSFEVIFVFNDSSKKIDHVSFMNTYQKSKMTDYKIRFLTDYKNIVKYLVQLFGKKGNTGPDYIDNKSSQKNIKWDDADFIFTLTKDEIKATKNREPSYSFTFSIQLKR